MQKFWKICWDKQSKGKQPTGKTENIRGKKEMEKIMENDYLMSSIDEYFAILDRENEKRSKLVAKSLVKYLKKSKVESKYEALQAAK